MKTSRIAFLFLALATMTIVSCKKDEREDPKKEEDKADYTVIFWGMSGTNDYGVAADIITVAENYTLGRIGDNVNIAGLVKTSVNISDPTREDFDKTYHFHSGDIKGKTLDWDIVDENDEVSLYENAFNLLSGKVYADTSYPLDNVDSLAAFINRTAKEFPAHNYVLLLLGHGGGYSPAEEAPLTKACMYDNYANGAYLTADAVVKAVQKSGVKMQTIFTQCCLMSTLENIAAYSQVFEYGILSAEITYSYYFPEYLVKLSAAGNDEQKMQAASRELVDYYVNKADSPDTYTTHGFYNLTKASQVLLAVKDIASWYNVNYKTLKEGIDNAVCNTIYCNNLEGAEDTEALRAEREFIQALMYNEDLSGLLDGVTFEEFMMNMAAIFSDLLKHSISYGFPFAHLLSATESEIGDANFKSLSDKYMQALKDMAYIRATAVPDNAEDDYEYIYCSPTINIFGMNEQCFIPLFGRDQEKNCNDFIQAVNDNDVDKAGQLLDEMFGGSPFANYVTLEQAETNYTSSVFDKQVNWSAFLKQLDVNPSVIYNPDRQEINEKLYGVSR